MLGSGKNETRKPKYSRFTQQELPACRLLLTPAVVIQSLFIVSVIFIPLGAVTLSASNQVVEVVTRYDDQCLLNVPAEERDSVTRTQNSTSCSLAVQIPSSMSPPIYVYYQLTNFYQNYRRYVKSQSEAQLAGANVTGSGLDVCAPEQYLGNNEAYPIRPCGLIAWSLFNDTFDLSSERTGLTPLELPLNKSTISWPSDRNAKFGPVTPQNFNTNASLRGGKELLPNITLNKAQDLQVWMRTAALPTFRKLYGVINQAISAGTKVNVAISNNYNSYAYGGEKLVVISTASWLGGKNSFLGIAYLTVGSICLVLALVFFVLQFTNRRPLGDTSYLSWNRKGAESANRPLGPMPVMEPLEEVPPHTLS